MKLFPALNVRTDSSDLLLADLDDFSPTAVEAIDDGVRVFFGTASERDLTCAALSGRYVVEPIDVPDEDWARRSQEGLQPVAIGRITVVPRARESSPPAASSSPSDISIVIQPSMGFGTGHHATTQLCLEALQRLDVSGLTVLDVGTGSGVLAIAAVRLGAARARGIDVDADAIQAANENLAFNPEVAGRVVFAVDNVDRGGFEGGQRPDVITANLTGALLVRAAGALLNAAAPGGWLILSGLQNHERDEVAAAMGAARVVWERAEGDWVGLLMKK